MRILRVCLRVPYPLNEGSSIESFNTTKQLALRGHEVVMVAFEGQEGMEADTQPLRQYCELHVIPFRGRNSVLNVARGVAQRIPVNYVKYYDQAMLDKCLELLRGRHFDVVVIDHTILGWYAQQIRRHSAVPIVLRFHDSHTLIWERWVRGQRNPLKSALGWLQCKLVRRYETEVALRSDLCLMIGARDAEVLKEMAPGANIQFVPAGIDVDHYAPPTLPPEPASILYLASHYRWHPNWDAVSWLYQSIMPRVWERVPHAKLYITGKHTPAEMNAWTADGRVVLTGYVPDERDVIAKSSVVVIPMRMGAGVKLKLLTAFASGKAVVSTPVGAEGVPELEHGRHLMICEGEDGFAAAIAGLIEDESLRQRLEANGRVLAREQYDWRVLGRKWEEALAAVMDRVETAQVQAQ